MRIFNGVARRGGGVDASDSESPRNPGALIHEPENPEGVALSSELLIAQKMRGHLIRGRPEFVGQNRWSPRIQDDHELK